MDLSYASVSQFSEALGTKPSSSIKFKRTSALGDTTATATRRDLTESSSTDPLSASTQYSQPHEDDSIPALPIRSAHVTFIVLLSLPVIVWVTRFHGHAQVEVVRYLHHLGLQQKTGGETASPAMCSVGFLMPCHSTPGQAYLHTDLGDGKIWSLSCEPPLG